MISKVADENNLKIKTVTVNAGPVLKRSRPRSRGMANQILKRTSRITIVLSEKNEQNSPPIFIQTGHIAKLGSRWFNPVKYRHLLKADVLIREALVKSMRGMYVEGIEIERSPAVFHLIIKNFPPRPSYRPERGRSRQNQSPDNRNNEEDKSGNTERNKIDRREEIQHPESSAMILAQIAAENLEKGCPFEGR